MRKYLLCYALMALAFVNQAFAQSCDVTTPVVSNISTNSSNGSCTVTFDLQFNLSHNSGNKKSAIYIYSGNLPTGFYGNGKTVPVTSQINAVTNILGVVEFAATSTTSTQANYDGGGGTINPTVFKPSLPFSVTAISGTLDQYQIKGITVVVPDCSQAVTLKADFGSANGSSFNQFGCLNTISFIPNTPALVGLLGCGNPRYFNFSATTLATETLTFSAYSDAAMTQPLSAPAGFIYTGNGAPAGGIAITTYQNITVSINANSPTTFGQFLFSSVNGSKFDVYLSIKESTNSLNSNSLQISNTCASLPVNFKTFNAARTSKSKVALSWETASESNNSGFDVQRKIGGGAWENVGFVFSQATAGNSSSTLSYQFNDANAASGVSQYRLRQVDIDKRSNYSDIRSVKGEGQAAKVLVFPNPSLDGKLSVVFEESGNRSVEVSDISGRVVKQYRSVSGNTLQIEGLENGMYQIHITDRSTSQSSVEKVIIKKR